MAKDSGSYINHNAKPEGKNPSVPTEHEAQDAVDKLAQKSVSGGNAWASHKGTQGK